MPELLSHADGRSSFRLTFEPREDLPSAYPRTVGLGVLTARMEYLADEPVTDISFIAHLLSPEADMEVYIRGAVAEARQIPAASLRDEDMEESERRTARSDALQWRPVVARPVTRGLGGASGCHTNDPAAGDANDSSLLTRLPYPKRGEGFETSWEVHCDTRMHTYGAGTAFVTALLIAHGPEDRLYSAKEIPPFPGTDRRFELVGTRSTGAVG
ncbi:hypothetical protein ABZX40_22155 [Streptomyces sp. NPDC004610]|uniref:hypothetical protein n=1 Tax=unclassified Streptomyces TaxID=2593676 RepID=UPI0033BAEB65